jgi:hypothetical protein
MKRKVLLFAVFFVTVGAVLVFASLWPQRQVVAWVLCAVFGSFALALLIRQVKSMTASSSDHSISERSS